jgi:hypothetical protein
MKKSLITTAVVFGLIGAITLTSAPLFAGAQSVYYAGYNARPYWNTLPNLSVVQGQSVSASLVAIDENGDQLTYTLVQAPQGAAFNPATRTFNFTPNYTQLGSFPVSISATDGKSTPAVGTFYVNVTTDYGRYVYGGGDYDSYYNQAPYFSATTSLYRISSGSTLTFKVLAIDPENQTIRYSVAQLPAGASFDNDTREFKWTPVRGDRGTYTLNFYASDTMSKSLPFSVTIVVDGGVVNANPVNANPGSAYAYYPNYTGTTGTVYGTSYASTGAPYFTTTASAVANAGTTYTYDAEAFDASGQRVTYALTNAPVGASIDANTGFVTWYVPSNAANGQIVSFTVTAMNAYGTMPATQTFTVAVQGGTPKVTTVSAPATQVIRYVETAPVSSVTTNVAYTGEYYSANNRVVTVSAGRVVPPTNYRYAANIYDASYAANAYGAVTVLPASAVSIDTFNISVRVNADRETIVAWDTNKPTRGEVVFGYASQSRGSDLDRTILNYDFTTGELAKTGTRHEANLGRLSLDRTYYLRVVSRADNQTNISREIVFIPMTTEDGRIIVEQREGAASAAGSLSNFLVSGGFLFLLLVVLGLIIYLIILNRRPVVYARHDGSLHASTLHEPELHIAHHDASAKHAAPVHSASLADHGFHQENGNGHGNGASHTNATHGTHH